MRKIGLLCITLLTSALILAQERAPLFYMDNATKKVNVQELGLSPTTTIYEVFQLFPELLHGSEGYLDGYSVQVDGQDVGNNKHITVRQMTIGEVKVINIEENASASYTRNGNVGSINIETLDIPEGICGSASATVSTEANALGSCNVNYRKDKLSIKSILRLDYYRADGDRQIEDKVNDVRYSLDDVYYRTTNLNEMAKIALYWNPTAADELKVRLWQSYSKRRSYNENEMHTVNEDNPQIVSFSQTEVDSINHAHTAAAFLQYSHTFAQRHKLKVEASYNYNGNGYTSDNFYYISGVDSLISNSQMESHPHSVNGKLEYEATAYKNDKHELKLKMGVNGAFSAGRANNVLYTFAILGQDTLTWGSFDQRYSCSPYAELNYKLGRLLSLRAGANYQYVHLSDGEKEGAHHLYNYNVCLTAMPAEGHSLRATAARNELAVSLDQRRGHTYTASLAYIYDGRIGEHLVNSELGLAYSRVHDRNIRYNVWSPRLSLYYQYRWFSLALGFNLFDNQWLRQNEDLQYMGYYNIRLNPIFRLPREWQISATMLYNSTRITASTETPRYFFTALHLNKSIGDWDLHLTLNDLLHYRTTAINNRVQESGYSFVTYTNTHYYPRYALLGVAYHF